MSYLSNSELASNQKAVPMWPLDQDGFERWNKTADATQRRWVEQAGFTAAAGELCAVPDTDGALGGYVFGMQEADDITQLAALAGRLPGRLVSRFQWADGASDEQIQALIGGRALPTGSRAPQSGLVGIQS